MKTLLWIGVLGTMLAVPAFAADTASTVRFANGDQLSGSMESLTPERLVWKSPVLEKPASFLLENVLDVAIPATTPEIQGKHEASVSLTNGDLIRGQLAGVGDNWVDLDTWFAGRMRFNRPMISEVRIRELPELAYRGPTGLEGWEQSSEKPAWTFQGSSFRSSAAGGIARNVKLPEECSVSFDVSWRSSIGLRVVLFSNDPKLDRPATGYEVAFQQRSVQARNCKTQKFLGSSQNAVALQESEKARIEIRASAKTGKICVLIDGKQIDQPFLDPDAGKLEIGRAIHFFSNSQSPVVISRIEVASWDGESEPVLEQPVQPGMRQFGIQEMGDDEDEPEPKEKPSGARMDLRNGDSILGEVTAVENDTIRVKTPFREVKLPIEALLGVVLKPVDAERCKRENGDVRAWFSDGTSVVFRLDAVEDGVLAGFSQNFGTARFKTAAFSRIEFNIYDQNLEDVRLSSGGW